MPTVAIGEVVAGNVLAQLALTWDVNLAYNRAYDMLREFMPDVGQYFVRRRARKAAAKSRTNTPWAANGQSN